MLTPPTALIVNISHILCYTTKGNLILAGLGGFDIGGGDKQKHVSAIPEKWLHGSAWLGWQENSRKNAAKLATLKACIGAA